MSPSTITLLFLLFAVIMFVLEKIPLGVTSMIVCIGLVVTGVLDVKTALQDSSTVMSSCLYPCSSWVGLYLKLAWQTKSEVL